MGALAIINTIVLSFLLAELIITVVFTKDWKFRFSSIEDYPGLKPFAKTWKIVCVLLLIIIVIIPLLDWIFWSQITGLISKLGIYQWFLLFFMIPMAYLWTEKKIVGRKWKGWDAIPITISVISLGTGILVWYLRNRNI